MTCPLARSLHPAPHQTMLSHSTVLLPVSHHRALDEACLVGVLVGVGELRAPIRLISDHVIVESPLPEAAAEAGALSAGTREEAVNTSDEAADGFGRAERDQHVIVRRHDHVAMEGDGAAVSPGDVQVEEKPGELLLSEERASTVHAASEIVGTAWEVEPGKASVAHSDELFGQEASSCPTE